MPSPIPPPGSHFITLKEFNDMKDFYAKNAQDILKPEYANKEILVTSETFNADLLVAIQQVTGFAGFRICYGMTTDKKVHAMLIAVDKDGNGILPDASATFANNSAAGGGGVAGETGQRCPPAC